MIKALKKNKQKKVDDNFDFDFELERIQKNLFSFIFSILISKPNALDVLQETNLIVCKKKKEFDPKKGGLKTWAFRIARFQIMAFLQKSKRNKLSFNSEFLEDMMDQSKNMSKQDLDLESKALSLCYETLPEQMAIIAKLWYKEEKTMKEISKITGRSIGAVSSTMHRMRQALTKCAKRKINQYEVYGRFENE